MKKFLGAIVSAVAGIAAFIMLSLDWLETKVSATGMGSSKEGVNGWDMIKDKVDIDGYTLYKIFAIVMLIVAVLLIVMAVVMLLKSLGVLKFGANLSFINNILLSVLVVSVILAIVGVVIMADEMSGKSFGIKVSAYPAVGAWLQLAVSVVACGLGWGLARNDN